MIIVSLFMGLIFFLKLLPECRKSMKLYSHCVTVYEIDFFLKTAPRMQYFIPSCIKSTFRIEIIYSIITD